MLKFLIKKSFFDAWDNILKLVVINLGFILLLFTAALPLSLTAGDNVLFILLSVLPGILLLHLYAGTVSPVIRAVSDFKPADLKLMKKGFLETWKMSLVIALVNSLVFTAVVVGIPFYMSFEGLLGQVAVVLLVWAGIMALMCGQFYFAVYTRFEGGPVEIMKKTLLITVENPFFAFFVLLFSVMLSAISVFTALIVPGISAVMLFQQNYIKMRIYKFQWLEKNSAEGGKKIPWKQILKEDDEMIGKRSFKGFIFPWKE